MNGGRSHSTGNMLHRIKHCFLFPCKLRLPNRRRQILLVIVTTGALITILLAGFDFKSLQSHGTHFPLTMAPTEDLAADSFDLLFSYGYRASALSTVVPTRLRDLTSSRFVRKRSSKLFARIDINSLQGQDGVDFPLTMAPTAPHNDCKSWKTTSRHKTTLITKTVCERQYFLLILVSSAPENFDRRDLIRQTWGAYHTFPSNW